MIESTYFRYFESREPVQFLEVSKDQEIKWQIYAGISLGLACWYLWWRWHHSFNPDALVFSSVIFVAEVAMFIGTLLFYFDIWAVRDTKMKEAICVSDQFNRPISVDIFITVSDESPDLVAETIRAAKAVECPPNTDCRIFILDDGNSSEIRESASRHSIGYLSRNSNEGFKAGNLKNALFRTSSDFFVICDADTRLFPSFLVNTLGYFEDRDVAWVQTPHWFYDLPHRNRSFGSWLARKAGLAHRTLGPEKLLDPFLADPNLFFDVIQRGRNRNGAAFCCGASSIHRREAVFEAAIQMGNSVGTFERRNQSLKGMKKTVLEPFKFHVSEDIFTSIRLQSSVMRNWKSVYHPQIESKMLSPWSLRAWATQRLKYAGGTFDIMLKANPIFSKGMRWTTKIHYLATFWSYLSVLWVPLLLIAPVYTLFTGISPVKSYTLEFFLHLLPVLVSTELAMHIGCRQHDRTIGHRLNIACLPLHLRALFFVLAGKKPRFPSTPKIPTKENSIGLILPHIALLLIMALSAAHGIIAYQMGLGNFSLPLLIVNFFWLIWNAKPLLAVVEMWRFDPVTALSSEAKVDG